MPAVLSSVLKRMPAVKKKIRWQWVLAGTYPTPLILLIVLFPHLLLLLLLLTWGAPPLYLDVGLDHHAPDAGLQVVGHLGPGVLRGGGDQRRKLWPVQMRRAGGGYVNILRSSHSVHWALLLRAHETTTNQRSPTVCTYYGGDASLDEIQFVCEAAAWGNLMNSLISLGD